MKYKTERPDWITFNPVFSSRLYFEKAGYFDERPQINTGVTQLIVIFSLPILLTYSFWWLFALPLTIFGWGDLYIHLPIKTGREEAFSPEWGVRYFDNAIQVCLGAEKGQLHPQARVWIIPMPWEMVFYKKSTLLEDESWLHQYNNGLIKRTLYADPIDNALPFDAPDRALLNKWVEDNKRIYKYEFYDLANQQYVPSTISRIIFELRPRMFFYTKLFAVKIHKIEIEFSESIGVGKAHGNGITGMSMPILPMESYRDTFERLQRIIH